MTLEHRGSVAALAIVLVASAALACGAQDDAGQVASSLFPDARHDSRPKLQVYGRDITSGWANVSVLRDGVPVDDASVVVNGQAIPRSGAEDGLYSGPLPALLHAHGKVRLEVAQGDLTVRGRGRLPESPVLTSPSPDANVSTDDAVQVTWTSASAPDYFEVWAQWSCGAACGTGRTFIVDRDARSFTIPAGALPGGQDVVVTVAAYDDGKLHGDDAPFAPYPGMNIRAESSSVTLRGAPRERLVVYGRDMGGRWANVSVMRGTTPVDDAIVEVNGQLIPRWPNEAGEYSAMLQPAFAPGETISLRVTSGGSVVTGSGPVPEDPVLTSATGSPGSDVAVTWTSPTDPEYFTVFADWSCGPSCGTGRGFDVPGSTRSFTIPASAVPGGMELGIRVFAYNDGTLGGDYTPWDAYPGMNIRGDSGSIPVRH